MEDGTTRKILERAYEAGSSRDYKKAAGLLEKLITESSEPVPEALLLLGRAYHAQGEFPRALAAFRDYLHLKPGAFPGYLFAGRSYLAMDMPGQAIQLLRRAVQKKETDVQALYLLGLAYFKGKKSTAATHFLQRAVECSPENKRIYNSYLNALLVRGIRQCRYGDEELGAQILDFVIKNGLEAPLPHLELARYHRNHDDFQQALFHYDRAIQMAPGDPSLRWYRASLLMALGRNSEAHGELEYLRALDETIPELQWNEDLIQRFMIRTFLEEGSWRRAAEACGAYLRIHGNEATVHLMYAEALRNMGDPRSAHNHLDRAAEQSGDKLELRYARIMLAWEEKNWEDLRRNIHGAERLGGDENILIRFRSLMEAHSNPDDRMVVKGLQEAIRVSGPLPELMYALAARYLRLGLTDLAEHWYNKTRNVEGNNEEAYLGELAAAEAQAKEGDGEAKKRLKVLYRNYLEKWPDNVDIRREWALLLVNNEEYAQASEELQALLAWEADNPSLRRLLAYTYRKTARYREAAVLLKSLLRDTPHSISLLLEFSGCLERAGASDYALEILERGKPLFKDSCSLCLALGDLRYRKKQVEIALEAYREAASRSPRDPRPYRRMAAVYRKTGVQEQAARYEREAEEREKK